MQQPPESQNGHHIHPSTTLLLVEDEAITALSERRTLENHGYEVMTAHSGERAVEMATNEPDIGLVLMDIDLGSGIDGTEAAQQILHRRELPIVFLTSHTEKEFVERAKTITNYGYVVKGSGEFVLIESVGMALQLFDAHRRTAKRQLELGERVKELSCLYEVEHLIGDDELTEEQVLRSIAQLLPSTWQYPEITTARISLENQVFQSCRGAEAPRARSSPRSGS